MPLDFLFRRSEPRRPHWHELREPHFELPPALPAPIQVKPRPLLPAPARPGAEPPEITVDVRAMSPRQMAEWAHEMYMTGWIGWTEYQAAIPCELDPGYDATVGALTGETADPDRPRDMLRDWEERLDFVKRYYPDDGKQIGQAQRVLALLRWQEDPRRLDA